MSAHQVYACCLRREEKEIEIPKTKHADGDEPATMWVLGTKPKSLVRAISALNHWAVSQHSIIMYKTPLKHTISSFFQGNSCWLSQI